MLTGSYFYAIDSPTASELIVMAVRLLCRSALLFVFVLATSLALAEKVTIYRDSFGVPHIYADTLAGASFGAGYAQAEDRLEQLLQNYRLAAGTMSEIAGPSTLQYDVRSRMWQHDEVCREAFPKLAPKLQDSCRAYIAGVEKFMKDHPDQVPPWAQQLQPHYPIMLGRFIIWGWPEGQAAEDLERIGIKPNPVEYRGSNEWLIAPQRTAVGAPIALIDPHLSWYGPFRFYEQRMYAQQEDFAVSGASILGVPMPGLGHNQYLSIAMTTGGPDTSDVYEETVREDGHYLVDGEWRPLEVRKVTIRVRTADGIEPQEFTLASTHHGPIVARNGDKAYAMAIPYMDQAGLIEELYKVMTAKNLAEAKQALSSCQLMPQNVMIGTVDGDIFYVRTGRVPVRKHKHPTDRPVPGHDSKNDYAGIHPFEDLVQIENPPQGYMQNCNISPEWLMRESSLVPNNYSESFYLYNHEPGPAHQRAQMVLHLLADDDSVTVDEALEIAFSTQVWQAEAWQDRITQAWSNLPADRKSGDAKTVFEEITAWNRKSTPDSVGALHFYMFKKALADKALAEAVEVPADISDEQVASALAGAATAIRDKFEKLDVAYGDYFRVGRQGGDKSYPVGGGSVKEAGMATPRAISFGDGEKQRVGHGGQTSTQVVILTKPPKSYMVLPLGQSDHPDSGHWDDQAEMLFGPGKAKDTFFLNRDGLMKEVTVTTELQWQ